MSDSDKINLQPGHRILLVIGSDSYSATLIAKGRKRLTDNVVIYDYVIYSNVCKLHAFLLLIPIQFIRKSELSIQALFLSLYIVNSFILV